MLIQAVAVGINLRKHQEVNENRVKTLMKGFYISHLGVHLLTELIDLSIPWQAICSEIYI